MPDPNLSDTFLLQMSLKLDAEVSPVNKASKLKNLQRIFASKGKDLQIILAKTEDVRLRARTELEKTGGRNGVTRILSFEGTEGDAALQPTAAYIPLFAVLIAIGRLEYATRLAELVAAGQTVIPDSELDRVIDHVLANVDRVLASVTDSKQHMAEQIEKSLAAMILDSKSVALGILGKKH